MTRKKAVTAHAVGRKPVRRMITAFTSVGLTVRPWKRAMILVFIMIDILSISVLVWVNPNHLPLLLILPVISMMAGHEYLTNTQGRRRHWWLP